MILLAENPKEYINIQISIAALFLIAKKIKQSKYPSTGEWINKCGIFINLEYCSAQIRSQLSTFYNTDKFQKPYAK